MSEIRGPVHLVGIGGMHMSAIAQLLADRGVAVRGSDLLPSGLTEKLAARGIPVVYGHDAANVGDAVLVVRTAAAGDDNPEIVEARRRAIPVLMRAEMVARLMEGKRVIAVAGSHGKTTTSSLAAFILAEAGHDPMYLLGGESRDLGGNAAWGSGPHCVVEADEYRRAFLEYSPAIAVITNVEPDHLDYYGTAGEYHDAFAAFAQRVPMGGRLVACADDRGAVRASAAASTGVVVERYGITDGDWRASGLTLDPCGGTRFTVARGGKQAGELVTALPGRHVVLNALAATAVCAGEGVSFDAIGRAVAAFKGARRRFELVGEAAGVTVVDDYAHHPTEVRATLAAARERFAGRRIFAIYQPHTYSRTGYLWDDWLTCWAGLDGLIVLETYAAREQPAAGRSAAGLAAAITRPRAVYASDVAGAISAARSLVRAGDVVFTIGAGDVNEAGPKLLEALR